MSVRVLLNSIIVMVGLIFFAVSPLNAKAETPPGLAELLKASEKKSRLAFRYVLESALDAWPQEKVDILSLAREIHSDWLTGTEISEVSKAQTVLKAEETRQRSRGIFYYLDPTLWNSQAEFGASLTTGDTQERAVALALHFDRDFGKQWHHSLDLDLDFARRLGETSRQRFVGEYASRFKPFERTYFVNYTRLDVDRFSGYDYRVIENVGVGYEFLSGERQTLSLETGLGLRLNKLDETGETSTEFLARASANYGLVLSRQVKLDNTVSALLGSNSVTIENDLSLSAQINSSLAARFSFALYYESEAPTGSAPFDTVTRATLVYDF